MRANSDIFIEACKKFASMKLILTVNDKEGKNTASVQVLIPNELHGYYKKQFGAVQYMKNHVEVRFYTDALAAFNLISVIENKNTIEHMNNNNGKKKRSSYCIYKSPNHQNLNNLFDDLLFRFKLKIGTLYEQLEETTVPDIAYKLPIINS